MRYRSTTVACNSAVLHVVCPRHESKVVKSHSCKLRQQEALFVFLYAVRYIYTGGDGANILILILGARGHCRDQRITVKVKVIGHLMLRCILAGARRLRTAKKSIYLTH